jgi:hypothetical protein
MRNPWVSSRGRANGWRSSLRSRLMPQWSPTPAPWGKPEPGIPTYISMKLALLVIPQMLKSVMVVWLKGRLDGYLECRICHGQ